MNNKMKTYRTCTHLSAITKHINTGIFLTYFTDGETVHGENSLLY